GTDDNGLSCSRFEYKHHHTTHDVFCNHHCVRAKIRQEHRYRNTDISNASVLDMLLHILDHHARHLDPAWNPAWSGFTNTLSGITKRHSFGCVFFNGLIQGSTV